MSGTIGNLNAGRHLAHSQSAMSARATVQKRRLLRQIGLRASDLDGVGQALLDNWARAQSKVEAFDAWAAANGGWVRPDGSVPGFVATYFAALNSARLSLAKFSDHLKARGRAPSMVTILQHRRPAS